MQSLVTRKKELPLSEKQIETQILQYLECVANCYAWKNQSVGIYDPSKKTFRKPVSKYSINGVSDILGIYNGRMLAIEVKTPKNTKRTESQNKFIEQITRLGGIAFYATSVNEVKEKLKSYE